ITIARPTAASAAATAITKNTKTWPSMPTLREIATNARFTAFSISSMHMNRMIALRRNTTPATPRPNRIALSQSDWVIISDPPLGQQHRADDGDEQQDRRQLERHDVVAEERHCDRADRIQLGDRRIDALRAAEVDECTLDAERARHRPGTH